MNRALGAGRILKLLNWILPMKTMSLAFAVAALLAAPALAQQAPTASSTAAAANIPATVLAPPNKTDQSKDWTVGQKMPAAYTVTSKFALSDADQYGLPKANNGSRWMLVGDNAYLVRTTNDIIIKIVGVTPKS